MKDGRVEIKTEDLTFSEGKFYCIYIEEKAVGKLGAYLEEVDRALCEAIAKQEEKPDPENVYFMYLTCPCEKTYIIKERADFPKHSVQCECGNYFVKYEKEPCNG